MGGHGTVWLAEAKTALPVLIWVGVWASIPFTTVTLLAGLQGIGGDVLEAASLDGADGWRRFRFIILPLLRPVLNVAVVLNTIYVFNSFPIIWVMTKGEPANGTHTLITYLYQQAFVSSQTGAAQAMGVLSFGVLMVFSMLYLRVAEKEVA
jgi:multiple sugar transport system permease protein